MLKSVLLPLDRSPASESARDFAIGLVARRDALVEGLVVVDVPTITAGAAAPIGGAAFKHRRDDALIDDARMQLAESLADFERACRLAVVMHRATNLDGVPYDVINDRARLHDLIVIGRGTCFHFETSEAFDVTLGKLLKDSARPLFVVPGEIPQGGPVIVAADGGLPSARSVLLFAQFELHKDDSIHVVSIADSEEQAKDCAEITADYLRVHGYAAQGVGVASGEQPWAIILDQIVSQSARALVMGAHSARGLRDFFFGSTASKLINGSTVPIFIHH